MTPYHKERWSHLTTGSTDVKVAPTEMHTYPTFEYFYAWYYYFTGAHARVESPRIPEADK